MMSSARAFGTASLILTSLALPSLVPRALAETIGGVEFPQGAKSFADRVVSFAPGLGSEPPYNNGAKALGAPDYTDVDDETYAALGNGTANTPNPGVLVLEFVDNRLIDVPGNDLYIFEIGPVVEASDIAISVDGVMWYELGKIQGATRGLDIAGKAAPLDLHYRFVRISDPPGNSSNAPYAGADIDAVGAIGSDVRDGDQDGVLDVDDQCPAQQGSPPSGCLADAGSLSADAGTAPTPDAGTATIPDAGTATMPDAAPALEAAAPPGPTGLPEAGAEGESDAQVGPEGEQVEEEETDEGGDEGDVESSGSPVVSGVDHGQDPGACSCRVAPDRRGSAAELLPLALGLAALWHRRRLRL